MPDESARPSAGDIFERVADDARSELDRPAFALIFSGLFAGATIGFSALAAALVHVSLGEARGADLLAALIYPIGFVAVIIGRAQLFTENTLYPVALALSERGHVRPTLRLWGIVLAANMVGTTLFALLVTQGGGVPEGVPHELARLGAAVSGGSFFSNFWSAVIAGWLLALVAWLVESADIAIGQIAVIWALTTVVGLGQFDHSVASTAEVLAGTFDGTIGIGHTFGWIATAVLGNAAGGVLIVTFFNWGQTRGGQ